MDLAVTDDTAIGALPLQAPMRTDGVKSARSRWAARTNGLDGPASLVLPAHNWTFCMHTALFTVANPARAESAIGVIAAQLLDYTT